MRASSSPRKAYRISTAPHRADNHRKLPTRIFLANDRAIEPQIAKIYRRFGLNDRQIEILARATPKRDYYCQSGTAIAYSNWARDAALAFTAASSKTDQNAIATLIAEHGQAVSPSPGSATKESIGPPIFLPCRRLRHESHRFRLSLATGIALLSLSPACEPAHAQMAVFDAGNFAENVMTAARELQQVNNEIQSLENQATMLINQAKNLARCPTPHWHSSINP